MPLADLVLSLGLMEPGSMRAAMDEQRRTGGRLREILARRSGPEEGELLDVLEMVPEPPQHLEALGIDRRTPHEVFLKAVALGLVDSAPGVAVELRVSHRVASEIVEQARVQKLIEVRPSPFKGDLRFELSERGRQLAADAFAANGYVGPLPVSLADYTARIRRQARHPEAVHPELVEDAFADLVTSEELLERIGSAANSGRAALLYGAPGNGKTTVAERIGRLFPSFVMVPHCFEVAGQIIKVFDPSVHRTIIDPELADAARAQSIMADGYDERWVPCWRPFVVTGGELTLEMLDLKFNPYAKFYEAPVQVKASNGVLLLDDFGRQLVQPHALLNRWIVPMDRQVDHHKLHTGKNFSLPFDVLLLFSTNLEPADIMDTAFLRRLPHKIEIGAPSEEQYREIFRRVLASTGMQVPKGTEDYVIGKIREQGAPLAAYQPRFLMDQARDRARYLGRSAYVDRPTIDLGLKNLLAAQI